MSTPRKLQEINICWKFGRGVLKERGDKEKKCVPEFGVAIMHVILGHLKVWIYFLSVILTRRYKKESLPRKCPELTS